MIGWSFISLNKIWAFAPGGFTVWTVAVDGISATEA